MRQQRRERRKRSGSFSEQVVEEFDDLVQLGVVELELFSDENHPERVDDAQVHGSV